MIVTTATTDAAGAGAAVNLGMGLERILTEMKEIVDFKGKTTGVQGGGHKNNGNLWEREMKYVPALCALAFGVDDETRLHCSTRRLWSRLMISFVVLTRICSSMRHGVYPSRAGKTFYAALVRELDPRRAKARWTRHPRGDPRGMP